MKLTKEDKRLIEETKNLWKKKHSKKHSVASILISKSGEKFDGMSMEFSCGISVCAERSAILKMMPDENEIDTIVALDRDVIMPPCGVCREFMYEMNEKNLKNTWVIVTKTKKVKLKDLYPYDWLKAFK